MAPLAEISLANAAPRSSRISVARTRAPLAVRRRTSLAPMPLLAPVLRATLPLKSLTALPYARIYVARDGMARRRQTSGRRKTSPHPPGHEDVSKRGGKAYALVGIHARASARCRVEARPRSRNV